MIHDLDVINNMIEKIQVNIDSIESVLDSERKKLAKYEFMKEQAEGVMATHGLPPCKRGESDHNFHITHRFLDGPHKGKWRKRKCANPGCNTEETLGYR